MISGSRRFGGFLRDLRIARRMTLEDVERATLDEPEPVTRSLLSRLENGKARISTLKLMALARVYTVRLGLLAERLELEHRLAEMSGGQGQKATRAAHFEGARGIGPAGARLALAETLANRGSVLSARHLLEEIGLASLEPDDRARALCLYARTALDSGQELLARGAVAALDQVPGERGSAVSSQAAVLEAELLDREGEHDRALEAWLSALDAARIARCAELERRCLVRLAAAERRRGRLDRALAWCTRSSASARAANDVGARVQALIETGRVHRGRGRAAPARRAWRRARELARAVPLYPELFDVHLELWRLARAERDAVAERAALRALRHLARLVETLPHGSDDLRIVLDGEAPAGDDAARGETVSPPPRRSSSASRA